MTLDIAPHDFTTPIPDTSDEGVPLSLHSDQVHSLTYYLATCRSSRILYDVYGTLRPDQDPSYEVVLAADERMSSLVTEYAGLEPAAQTFTSGGYISRLTSMALAYRSYLVHRPFFIKSLRDPGFARSREACISAARTIMDISQQGIPEPFYRLWNITIWLVAAGLVVGLDTLKSASDHNLASDITEKRVKLDALAALLHKRADRSGIGIRGATMVRNLLVMETDVLNGRHKSLEGMTREDVLRIISPKPGDAPQRGSGSSQGVASGDDYTDHLADATEHFTEMDEIMNSHSFWTMDNQAGPNQLSFDPLATTSSEADNYMDFFTYLGQQ